MITVGPRLRVSHCQATLRVLEHHGAGAGERVLARLAPEPRGAISGALKGSFIPAAWDLALVEAIRDELGAAKAREVAREMMAASLRGPLLGGLVRGAQALFGREPAGLFRWAGNAYGHVTRECGVLTLESMTGDEAILRMDAMPAELAVPDYLDAIAGTIEGIFELCGVEGCVEVAEPRADGATFRATWRG